jgi:hypothetical protein
MEGLALGDTVCNLACTSCLSTCFIFKTVFWISIKFGILCLKWELSRKSMRVKSCKVTNSELKCLQGVRQPLRKLTTSLFFPEK